MRILPGYFRDTSGILPGYFSGEAEARARWDAWTQLGRMSKVEAMYKYAEIAADLASRLTGDGG